MLVYTTNKNDNKGEGRQGLEGLVFTALTNLANVYCTRAQSQSMGQELDEIVNVNKYKQVDVVIIVVGK